jgi:hypothetical protein
MFNFNSKYKEVFNKLKNRLISTLIIHYYNFNKDTILETNISNGVILEVLL